MTENKDFEEFKSRVGNIITEFNTELTNIYGKDRFIVISEIYTPESLPLMVTLQTREFDMDLVSKYYTIPPSVSTQNTVLESVKSDLYGKFIQFLNSHSADISYVIDQCNKGAVKPIISHYNLYAIEVAKDGSILITKDIFNYYGTNEIANLLRLAIPNKVYLVEISKILDKHCIEALANVVDSEQYRYFIFATASSDIYYKIDKTTLKCSKVTDREELEFINAKLELTDSDKVNLDVLMSEY